MGLESNLKNVTFFVKNLLNKVEDYYDSLQKLH